MLPTVPAGATARIEFGVRLLKLVAGTPPKVTAVGLARKLPTILTEVPPADGPAFGKQGLELRRPARGSAPTAICSALGCVQVPVTGACTVDRRGERTGQSRREGHRGRHRSLFAVNEPTLPGAVRLSGPVTGFGTLVVGMVKVAVWLRRRRPRSSCHRQGQLPEIVAARDQRGQSLAENWVLRAKLVRLNEPPGDTGFGEIDPVTVIGQRGRSR